MKSIKRQQGVTAIGWMIILAIVGFFVFIGLKLFPVYAEYFGVTASLKSVAKEAGLAQKSKREILRLINNRFNINDVTYAKSRDVTITKRGGRVTLTIEYSRKEKLFGPLSIIAEFKDTYESGS